MDEILEYYNNYCSKLKDFLLIFKERYKNLLKNTSDILNNLNKKESVLNLKPYLAQKKCLKQLKAIYKNELENLPKLTNLNLDVKEIKYNFLKQKIVNYQKCIKKYQRQYKRYLNKIRQYILFYDKHFVSKNKHESLSK